MKIDIYLKQPAKYVPNTSTHKGSDYWVYECSTTWSKTCREAKESFCKLHGLDNSQVKASKAVTA